MEVARRDEISLGEATIYCNLNESSGNNISENNYAQAKEYKIEIEKIFINNDTNNKSMLIKVKDEEGVQKIEYTLNGTLYSTDPNNTGDSLNQKEIEFKQPLASGSNTITLKAYSINGLVEEVTGEVSI